MFLRLGSIVLALRIGVACSLILVCAAAAVAQAGFTPRIRRVALSTDNVRAGESLHLSVTLENLGDLSAASDLVVFVHVRPVAPDAGGRPFGADFSPTLPTSVWPARCQMAETRSIDVPAGMPAGSYDLYAGMVDPGSGERATLHNDMDSERRLHLGRIMVAAGGDPRPTPHPVEWTYAEGPTLASAWNLLLRPGGGSAVTVGAGKARALCEAIEPRVERYLLGATAMNNEAPRLPARVRLRRVSDGRVTTVTLAGKDWRLTHTPDEARYACHVPWDGAAADFEVAIRAGADSIIVSVERVRENAGYELLDVILSPILGSRGPEGWLVAPTQAGRLIPLATAQPGQIHIGMDWFNTAICGAAGEPGIAAVLDSRDVDNELNLVVTGDTGSRIGFFEPRFALRAEASAKAARIKLASAPSFRIRLTTSRGGSERADWVDAAKVLRRDVAGRPNPLYSNTMLYKIFCDSPGATRYTTFEQALDIVRTVHRLAPFQKQVVYLVGWQYSGHDTGYPATDRINARLGDLDGLHHAIAEAAKVNAILSVHDNFDDAYRSSPAFDESLIARDAQGELCKGGVWGGGQSYILAFHKYAVRAAPDRIRATVARLGVRQSYHIDVLSTVPIRRDYNIDAPESSAESLEGKFSIIKEFNRLGLDVTSEGFTAPFVGKIGHSWHLWHRRDTLIEGEEAIPFIPFIYHGGPTCMGNGAQTDDYPRDSALWGAGYSADWTRDTDPHEMARAIYLVNAPWSLLRDRRMEGWSRHGTVCRVDYGPGRETFVEGDEASHWWRVVVDGVPVVENGLVTLRTTNGLTLFSAEARSTVVTLPAAWWHGALVLRNLLTGASMPIGESADRQTLKIDLPASEPMLLTPSSAAGASGSEHTK